MSLKIKNVIFDRDGTLIEDFHYLSNPNQIYLLSNVGPVLQRLQRQGHRLFLVTNQSGIARGYYTKHDYQRVSSRLRGLLCYFKVRLAGELFCPHSPSDQCFCRKPLPGMWEKLVSKYGLIAEETIMIGDKMSDIGFAQQANLQSSILVLTGYGLRETIKFNLPNNIYSWQAVDREQFPGGPDLIATDLRQACRWIISGKGSSR